MEEQQDFQAPPVVGEAGSSAGAAAPDAAPAAPGEPEPMVLPSPPVAPSPPPAPDAGTQLRRLVTLRKATRAVAEVLRGSLKEHLSVAGLAIRPKPVLGEYMAGGGKDATRGAKEAFEGVQRVFQRVTSARPFDFGAELSPPLELETAPLEVHPFEYLHHATHGKDSKTLTITCPLKWVLTYPGFSPARLRELLAQRQKPEAELRRFAIHYAVLHFLVMRTPAFGKLMDALRFPVSAWSLPEFGNLPLVLIRSAAETFLPCDEVLIENTEIAGVTTFEEVIDVEGLHAMRDPLQERVVEAAATAGINLMGGQE